MNSDEQEDAVHTMLDVLRNALAMGITTIKPLMILLEIYHGDEPFPSDVEQAMGMEPAALSQALTKLRVAGLVTSFRDDRTRSRRLALTPYGQAVAIFIEDGGEPPKPEDFPAEEEASEA
jgi:DNA-binding MarR family transcriptional regulator